MLFCHRNLVHVSYVELILTQCSLREYYVNHNNNNYYTTVHLIVKILIELLYNKTDQHKKTYNYQIRGMDIVKQ